MAKVRRKRKATAGRATRAGGSSGIDAQALREIALQFPDVADASTVRGLAFTARGRMLACSAIHRSAEPNSLVVRMSLAERPRLMAAHPDALYLTDHYTKHSVVLARLARLDRAALNDLLGAAWLFVTEKAVSPKRSRPRRKR